MARQAGKKASTRELLAVEGLWAGTQADLKNSPGRLVFRPGSGNRPPLIVGRNGAVEALMDLTRGLASAEGMEPSMGAVIFGPRGTGKTVLLNIARRCAAEAGAACVVLGGQRVHSPEDVRRVLLAGQTWQTEASRESGGRVGWGPLGGLLRRWKTLSRIGDADTRRALEIVADKRGCLVAVDEAHVMDQAAGGELLSAVQELRDHGLRVAVLLAGTPDLADHIGTMKATFFLNRLHPRMQIGCGLVAADDAVAGVTLPLASLAGLDAGPEWRDRIPDLTKGYPYFIQLLGAALAEAYEGRSGPTTDEARNRAALELFTEGVDAHYASVWRDLDADNLTACAVQIGHLSDVCAALGQAVPEAILDQAIDSGVRHPLRPQGRTLGFDEARLRMTHFGLLWRPTLNGPLTVGIPSFFSYAAERAERYGGEALNALREERPALLKAAAISVVSQ